MKKCKRKAKRNPVTRDVSDLEILERMIKEFGRQQKKKYCDIEVRDVLKAIQLKHKLDPSGKGEKIFWELIDQLREEELG